MKFGEFQINLLQLVYEAKASQLSQDITVSTAAEFRSCLDEMTDTHRVVDLCIQARSAVGDITNRVLKYALQRLLKNTQHNKSLGDKNKQVHVFVRVFLFGKWESVYCATIRLIRSV